MNKNEPKKPRPTKQAIVKKEKLVRDSFTFPKSEHKLLSQVKKKLVASGVEVKKVELVRVGLAFVAGASNSDLKRRLQQLPKLKTGRPKKKSGRKSGGASGGGAVEDFCAATGGYGLSADADFESDSGQPDLPVDYAFREAVEQKVGGLTEHS